MKPFVFGHRGAMAYEPENTLRSFKKAIDLGVDGIEFDVRRCKSGEIAVIHDEKVDRTTNGKGYVKDLSSSELKKFDAGKGERIPTLEELVLFIKKLKKKKQIKLILELKDKDIEKNVIDSIEKYAMTDDTIVISFYHEFVKNIKKINEKIKTGILFAQSMANAPKTAKEINAEFLFPRFNCVDENLIKNAHKNKLKVFVWNIDDIGNLKKMLELKVDGIGSNKPDVVVENLMKNNS